MTFMEACKYKMPFGKYKGQTLDTIAASNDGLKYLDWLFGELENDSLRQETFRYLKDYLLDPTIQKELEDIL